jgi:hypothetical protein
MDQDSTAHVGGTVASRSPDSATPKTGTASGEDRTNSDDNRGKSVDKVGTSVIR